MDELTHYALKFVEAAQNVLVANIRKFFGADAMRFGSLGCNPFRVDVVLVA
jgi:hypothetical protein